MFKIVLVASLFLVSCSKLDQDQQLISDLSTPNFSVFTNDEFTKDLGQDPVTQDMATMSAEMGMTGSRSFIEWSPDGTYDRPVEADCLHSQLDRLFSIPNLSNKNRAEVIQNWVDHCQPQLSSRSNRFVPLLMFQTVKYSMIQNKSLSKVKITLPDGTIIKGILGIKNDGKKRPLIIIQSGVHSNAEDSAGNRNFVMQIFDEGPFNILLLGNMTGSDYLRDNGVLALGGMEEGRHIIEVAQMLQNSETKIQNFISGIHLLGVSLGSHAALYSSLYNSYLDNPPLKSVMAYCPVVNLEPTIESTFDKTPRGWFYNLQTGNLFRKSFKYVPSINELLGKPQNWSPKETLHAIKAATFDYYKKKTLKKPWPLKPFEGAVFKKPEDVWAMNNFISQAKNVKTPTLLVYSEDDFFVLPKFNAEALQQSMQSNPNSNIGIVKFDTGNHCATSVANGWPTTSTLLRSYFMSQAFEKSTYPNRKVDLKRYINFNNTFPFFSKMPSSYIVSKTIWSFDRNNKLQIELIIYDKEKNETCFYHTPFKYGASLSCNKFQNIKIPIEAVEMFGVREMYDEFKKESLVRWLNTHVDVLDKNGDSVVGKNVWPSQLLVYGNYEY